MILINKTEIIIIVSKSLFSTVGLVIARAQNNR